jgi:nifR3 family TIM-barrel protein
MVRSVVEASTLPVTAKTRCGWDNDHKNGVDVAQLLEQCGVAMIAIHARTRAQKFEGKADWDVIAEAKRRVSIPLVGNGDVTSPAEARRMLEETGCDAVMIGRASFGNPWIFRATTALLGRLPAPAPPTARERLAMLVRQFRLATSIATERHAANEIRKHVAWYAKGLPNTARLKERGQKVERLFDLEAIVAEYLAEFEVRSDVPPAALVAGAIAGDDAWPADDGSAEEQTLAAQAE